MNTGTLQCSTAARPPPRPLLLPATAGGAEEHPGATHIPQGCPLPVAGSSARGTSATRRSQQSGDQSAICMAHIAQTIPALKKTRGKAFVFLMEIRSWCGKGKRKIKKSSKNTGGFLKQSQNPCKVFNKYKSLFFFYEYLCKLCYCKLSRL